MTKTTIDSKKKRTYTLDELDAKHFTPEQLVVMRQESKAYIAEYYRLREIREALEVTQARLAERLGCDQSEISRIEKRTDMYVGTLREYVASLGGELEIYANLPNGRYRINSFDLDSEDGVESVRRTRKKKR